MCKNVPKWENHCTVEPVLKDHAYRHRNVVSQDRWPEICGLSRQAVSHGSGTSRQVSLYTEHKRHQLLTFPWCVCVCSDPLQGHPDVHPEPILGPSLQFAGESACWTGDDHSFQGQKGLEARIAFETFAGERTTAHLEVVNDGTTCLYWDWKVSDNTVFLSI